MHRLLHRLHKMKKLGIILVGSLVSLLLLIYSNLLVIPDSAKEWLQRGKPSLPPRPLGFCPYFTKLHHYHQPLNLSCPSCAVVTNSGFLLNTEFGSEIDAHACVMRMNLAPAGGSFEKFVGKRTTLRVVSTRGFLEEYPGETSHTEQSKLLVWLTWEPNLFKALWKKELVRSAMNKIPNMDTREGYILTDDPGGGFPAFHTLMEREVSRSGLVSGVKESTGFHTMQVAGHVCDSITVYGLPPDDFCQTADPSDFVPYHYYGVDKELNMCHHYKLQNRKRHRLWVQRSHHYSLENMIFRRWASYRNITFRT